MIGLPLLSHPGIIPVIDDDPHFLVHLRLILRSETAKFKFFTDQEEALRFIKTYGMPSLNDGALISQSVENYGERTLRLKIGDLHRKTFDPARFSKIPAFIVDYQMPGINGLEFCRSIENPLVQKILLTGAADERFGNEALNKKWVHQYFRKDDPDIVRKIRRAVADAHRQCFYQMSEPIRLSLASSGYDMGLWNSTFIEFFERFKAEYKAVEYYLYETGIFLFVDADGNTRFLFLKTQEEADSDRELAEEKLECKPFMEDLKNYKKLICCYNSEGFMNLHGPLVEKIILDAQKIEGTQNYYWATGPDVFDVAREDIKPYNTFLNEFSS